MQNEVLDGGDVLTEAQSAWKMRCWRGQMWSETANIVARELLKGSYVLRHCKYHVKRGFQRKVKPEAVLRKACSPKQASAQTLSILEPKSLHRHYVRTIPIFRTVAICVHFSRVDLAPNNTK